MRFEYLANAALVAIVTASPIATPAAPIKQREVTTVTVSGTTATTYPQPATELQGFPIHQSCNATERNQLEKALGDTLKLVKAAADHIFTHGSSSEIYTRHFGDSPTAEAVGWYEKVLYGNREGTLIRCDDIDGNCQQDGWAGHWRGENATDETVICPLSYTTRQPLEGICSQGYTVANGKLATYFAADLLHRILHLESFGEEAAEHYADSYTECVELAKTDSAKAVRNTHSLQYFALDVYAFDVAVPGEGCAGTISEEEGTEQALASSSSAAPSATASSETGVVTVVADATSANAAEATASKTTSAGTECHTHASGEVHCA